MQDLVGNKPSTRAVVPAGACDIIAYATHTMCCTEAGCLGCTVSQVISHRVPLRVANHARRGNLAEV